MTCAVPSLVKTAAEHVGRDGQEQHHAAVIIVMTAAFFSAWKVSLP